MVTHPTPSLLVLMHASASEPAALIAYLETIFHLRVLFERADHLLLGEPIAAPLADSVQVVAILEAAVRSMRQGGALEVLHGG